MGRSVFTHDQLSGVAHGAHRIRQYGQLQLIDRIRIRTVGDGEGIGSPAAAVHGAVNLTVNAQLHLAVVNIVVHGGVCGNGNRSSCLGIRLIPGPQDIQGVVFAAGNRRAADTLALGEVMLLGADSFVTDGAKLAVGAVLVVLIFAGGMAVTGEGCHDQQLRGKDVIAISRIIAVDHDLHLIAFPHGQGHGAGSLGIGSHDITGFIAVDDHISPAALGILHLIGAGEAQGQLAVGRHGPGEPVALSIALLDIGIVVAAVQGAQLSRIVHAAVGIREVYAVSAVANDGKDHRNSGAGGGNCHFSKTVLTRSSFAVVDDAEGVPVLLGHRHGHAGEVALIVGGAGVDQGIFLCVQGDGVVDRAGLISAAGTFAVGVAVALAGHGIAAQTAALVVGSAVVGVGVLMIADLTANDLVIVNILGNRYNFAAVSNIGGSRICGKVTAGDLAGQTGAADSAVKVAAGNGHSCGTCRIHSILEGTGRSLNELAAGHSNGRICQGIDAIAGTAQGAALHIKACCRPYLSTLNALCVTALHGHSAGIYFNTKTGGIIFQQSIAVSRAVNHGRGSAGYIQSTCSLKIAGDGAAIEVQSNVAFQNINGVAAAQIHILIELHISRTGDLTQVAVQRCSSGRTVIIGITIDGNAVISTCGNILVVAGNLGLGGIGLSGLGLSGLGLGGLGFGRLRLGGIRRLRGIHGSFAGSDKVRGHRGFCQCAAGSVNADHVLCIRGDCRCISCLCAALRRICCDKGQAGHSSHFRLPAGGAIAHHDSDGAITCGSVANDLFGAGICGNALVYDHNRTRGDHDLTGCRGIHRILTACVGICRAAGAAAIHIAVLQLGGDAHKQPGIRRIGQSRAGGGEPVIDRVLTNRLDDGDQILVQGDITMVFKGGLANFCGAGSNDVLAQRFVIADRLGDIAGFIVLSRGKATVAIGCLDAEIRIIGIQQQDRAVSCVQVIVAVLAQNSGLIAANTHAVHYLQAVDVGLCGILVLVLVIHAFVGRYILAGLGNRQSKFTLNSGNTDTNRLANAGAGPLNGIGHNAGIRQEEGAGAPDAHGGSRRRGNGIHTGIGGLKDIDGGNCCIQQGQGVAAHHQSGLGNLILALGDLAGFTCRKGNAVIDAAISFIPVSIADHTDKVLCAGSQFVGQSLLSAVGLALGQANTIAVQRARCHHDLIAGSTGDHDCQSTVSLRCVFYHDGRIRSSSRSGSAGDHAVGGFFGLGGLLGLGRLGGLSSLKAGSEGNTARGSGIGLVRVKGIHSNLYHMTCLYLYAVGGNRGNRITVGIHGSAGVLLGGCVGGLVVDGIEPTVCGTCSIHGDGEGSCFRSGPGVVVALGAGCHSSSYSAQLQLLGIFPYTQRRSKFNGIGSIGAASVGDHIHTGMVVVCLDTGKGHLAVGGGIGNIAVDNRCLAAGQVEIHAVDIAHVSAVNSSAGSHGDLIGLCRKQLDGVTLGAFQCFESNMEVNITCNFIIYQNGNDIPFGYFHGNIGFRDLFAFFYIQLDIKDADLLFAHKNIKAFTCVILTAGTHGECTVCRSLPCV